MVKAGHDPSRNRSVGQSDEIAYKMLRRVLLVEDDIDDQFFAKQELKRLKRVGKVVCFSNGKELIQFLQAEQQKEDSYLYASSTVIIMDLNMPLMNGYETLKELRAAECIKNIPVIVVTSERAQWEIERIFSLMPIAVLRKPLKADKLLKFFEKEEHHSFWEGIWH
jgi:CheY-like chemotaxis protein